MAEQSNSRSIPTVRVTFTELEQIYRQTERKSKSTPYDSSAMRAGSVPKSFGNTSTSPSFTNSENQGKEKQIPRQKRPDMQIYTPPGRARRKEDGGAPSPELTSSSPTEAHGRGDARPKCRTVSNHSVTSEPTKSEEPGPLPEGDAVGRQETRAVQQSTRNVHDIPELFNSMEFVNSSIEKYPSEAPLDVAKGLVVWNSGVASPSYPADSPKTDSVPKISLMNAQSSLLENYPAFPPRERVKGRGRLQRPESSQVGASRQAQPVSELMSHVRNLAIGAVPTHVPDHLADSIAQPLQTAKKSMPASNESIVIQSTEKKISTEVSPRNMAEEADEENAMAYKPIIDWVAEVEKSEQDAQNESTEGEHESGLSAPLSSRGPRRRVERRSSHKQRDRQRSNTNSTSSNQTRTSLESADHPIERQQELGRGIQERKGQRENRRSQPEERKGLKEERKSHIEERKTQREERKIHVEERKSHREERKSFPEDQKGHKEERKSLQNNWRSRPEEHKTPQEERKSATKEQGLLHVPKYDMVVKGKMESEGDAPRRQLYDPENPDRPLCVVSPASHTASPAQEIPPRQRAYCGPEVVTPPYSHQLPQQYRPGPNFIPGYNFPPHMHSPRGPVFFGGMGPTHIPIEMARHSSPMMPPNMYKFSATEKNVQEALSLEQDLNMLLSHPFNSADLKKLGQCRYPIQNVFRNSLTNC